MGDFALVQSDRTGKIIFFTSFVNSDKIPLLVLYKISVCCVNVCHQLKTNYCFLTYFCVWCSINVHRHFKTKYHFQFLADFCVWCSVNVHRHFKTKYHFQFLADFCVWCSINVHRHFKTKYHFQFLADFCVWCSVNVQENILDGLANWLGEESVTEMINKARDRNGWRYMTTDVCRQGTK
jgi:hypothetical protein